MGKEMKEDVVSEMEDLLGLGEDDIVADATPKEDEAEDAVSADAKEEEESEKKEETKPSNTTLVTDEQLAINREIAKIDLQIEALEKEEVDVSLFYDNLEDELSEDEQALEFSDKSAYMKLVTQKAKEYEQKHSKADAIEALKEEKKEQEQISARQSAIVDVSTKYPEYNHEKIMNYFNEELSKSEQQKIFEVSESYADVYEKTYLKYSGVNPSNVSQQKAPNIPNVNNSRRESARVDDTDDGLLNEEQMLQDALGL